MSPLEPDGVNPLMGLASTREQSREVAEKLGYEVMAELPLLEADSEVRSGEELAERCLVLHALIAVSYGFPRSSARGWFEREGLVGALSASEARFLDTGDAQEDEFFHGLVESVWALVWSLGIATELDFGQRCPEDLVAMLPDLTAEESSSSFRERVKPRSTEEVVAAADLAYCLHWAVTDAGLRGGPSPGRIPAWVLTERRPALDWALSREDWDDITLDT